MAPIAWDWGRYGEFPRPVVKKIICVSYIYIYNRHIIDDVNKAHKLSISIRPKNEAIQNKKREN